MQTRIAWGVVGVLWMVCGTVVALSPPVEHGDGSTWSPLVGWALVAAGVFTLAIAVRGGLPAAGRHANGRTVRAGGGIEYRLIFSVLVGLFAGGVLIWVGVDTDQAALTSYGVSVLGMVVFGVPHIVDAVHHVLDR